MLKVYMLKVYMLRRDRLSEPQILTDTSWRRESPPPLTIQAAGELVGRPLLRVLPLSRFGAVDP